MRLAVLIVGWALTAAGATAADLPRVSAFDLPPGPAELPPLLPVPPGSTPPSTGPRGPNGEYDPGYFYLPERAPEGPRTPAACGPAGRLWIGPGLELAWIKPATAPALLRFGNATGPVLYGNERIAVPMQVGYSLTAGIWVKERHTIGFDASFLYLNAAGSDSLIGPTGDAALILPVAGVGEVPLALQGSGYVGAFQAGLGTLFASAEVNSRTNLLCSPDARLDALVGYRYCRISDDYEVYGKRLGPSGEIVRFRDEARTQNNFHGGQIGLVGELRRDRWFVSGSGKVAFGMVFSEATLEGKFRLNESEVPFGLYARPGLNGTRERSQFAVMPAFGLSVGREIGEHVRIAIGYNLLYLDRVARAPDLLDSAAGELPTTDFWAQSASLTAEWRY